MVWRYKCRGEVVVVAGYGDVFQARGMGGDGLGAKRVAAAHLAGSFVLFF